MSLEFLPPPLNFRFSVLFITKGIPDPLNVRFQKVSGLQSEMSTYTIQEGGANTYTHKLPGRIQNGNLMLERGFTNLNLLSKYFELSTTLHLVVKSDVLITLHNEDGIPVSSWMFLKAYPVKWSTTDFNADGNDVVIETMELAYQQQLKIAL